MSEAEDRENLEAALYGADSTCIAAAVDELLAARAVVKAARALEREWRDGPDEWAAYNALVAALARFDALRGGDKP